MPKTSIAIRAKTKQEKLNGKLLEWAGFELEFDESHHGCCGHWKNPKGEYIVHPPPIFPESLDACFKWLVPKLHYASIKWSQMSWKGDWTRVEIDGWIEAEAKTPAPALCLAIEKLIDSKEL